MLSTEEMISNIIWTIGKNIYLQYKTNSSEENGIHSILQKQIDLNKKRGYGNLLLHGIL